MHRFEDVIQANEAYASTFSAGELPAPPKRRLAVLTCMDCRILVHPMLGLAQGDAHVLRNAGARASDDAIRSLIKSTIQLGVERIAVIHHTSCGAMIDLDQLQDRVEARTGHRPTDIDFHLIGDPAQTLLDDVARLHDCAYLPQGTALAGFVYDVATGALSLRTFGEVGGELTVVTPADAAG